MPMTRPGLILSRVNVSVFPALLRDVWREISPGLVIGISRNRRKTGGGFRTSRITKWLSVEN
jgi:hypothetical protein